MESVAQALLLWIASHSHYQIDDISIPNILFLSAEEITAEYYGHRTDLIPDTGVDDRVLALYDASAGRNGAIYLRREQGNQVSRTVGRQGNSTAPSTLAPSPKSDMEMLRDDPVLTERLLHELVHHVQFQSGMTDKFPCRAYGEKEAYRLGGLYFRKRNVEDPIPNRKFWTHMYSRC